MYIYKKRNRKVGIFYKINLSVGNIISFIRNLITYIKLELENFNVYLMDLPFNVNDRKTWIGKGKNSITVLLLCRRFNRK